MPQSDTKNKTLSPILKIGIGIIAASLWLFLFVVGIQTSINATFFGSFIVAMVVAVVMVTVLYYGADRWLKWLDKKQANP